MSHAIRSSTVAAGLFASLCGCADLNFHPIEPQAPAPDTIARIEDSLKGSGVPDPVKFASIGYTALDQSCEVYFSAIVRADNTLKMTKADVAATGSAVAVIAALADRPQKVIGMAAAAFGLGVTALDNYDQYAFATPYPVQTHQLVRKALIAYRQSAPPTAVVSMEDAYDKVAGYARNCTFAGIADLSEQALSASSPTDANNASSDNTATTAIFLPSDRAIALPQVNELVAVQGQSPADADYLTLSAMAQEPDQTSFAALIKQLTPAISVDKILGGDQTKSSDEKDAFKRATLILNVRMSDRPAYVAAVNSKLLAVKSASAASAASGASAPATAPNRMMTGTPLALPAIRVLPTTVK